MLLKSLLLSVVVNKTGGIWVGKLKHSKDKIEGIKWCEKHIKTLGVYFGNNKEDCEKLKLRYLNAMIYFVYFYLKSLNIFIVSKS
jgi:hypothetical protein